MRAGLAQSIVANTRCLWGTRFGPRILRDGPGMEHSLYSAGRIDSKALTWMAAPLRSHVFNWNESTTTLFRPTSGQ